MQCGKDWTVFMIAVCSRLKRITCSVEKIVKCCLQCGKHCDMVGCGVKRIVKGLITL